MSIEKEDDEYLDAMIIAGQAKVIASLFDALGASSTEDALVRIKMLTVERDDARSQRDEARRYWVSNLAGPRPDRGSVLHVCRTLFDDDETQRLFPEHFTDTRTP